MKPNAGQVRHCILLVMDVAHPRPQTHADVASKLRWLANEHRIAMNMDRLARDGFLTVRPPGSAVSYTKQYQLVEG